MGKIRCTCDHCTCDPCSMKPHDCMDRCRREQAPVFLLERVACYGCLEGCQCLALRLCECVQIEEIVEVCYDNCIVDKAQASDCCTHKGMWRTEIPVTLCVRDACGATRRVKAILEVEIPMRAYTAMSEPYRSILQCSLRLLCVTRQCAERIEAQWNVSLRAYITCMQMQALCGAPAPKPCCEFPPIYPHPCGQPNCHVR